jgi:ketosteroid isomerase-like protein
MSADDVELVRHLLELWEQRDWSAVAEYVDPNLEFVRSGAGVGLAGEWRGPTDAWRAILEWRESFDELRDQVEDIIDAGDRVLVLVKQTARGRTSGAPVQLDAAYLITLRDRRVVRLETYADHTEGIRAAGLND